MVEVTVILVTFRSVTNIIICLVPNSIKIFSIFKQIPTLNYEIKSGFFVQKWRLLNSQKNIFWKLWGYSRKNGLDFLSRNDASSIPKIKLLEFLLDFLSRNDASSIHPVPDGLGVRIPGFHPGGPGSIPGLGVLFKSFYLGVLSNTFVELITFGWILRYQLYPCS